MKEYICLECAIKNGLIKVVDVASLNLTGSNYLLEKYTKHTIGDGSKFYSIYSDPSYDNYKNLTISASLSGSLEIVDGVEKNIIFYLGDDSVGVSIKDGRYYGPNNSVKIVYPENDGKIHSYPINIDTTHTSTCKYCGKLL